MQQQFTHEFMRKHSGCYTESMLAKCTFMKGAEPATLGAIVCSEISIKDKFWFICKVLATKEENKIIAIQVAEIVLPVYENRFPGNKAPREAIQAAKDFIAGKITITELREKRAAADAAVGAKNIKTKLIDYLHGFATNK
jgi:hypothetical protein